MNTTDMENDDALREWKRKREQRERERKRREQLLSFHNHDGGGGGDGAVCIDKELSNNFQQSSLQREQLHTKEEEISFVTAKKRRNEMMELVEKIGKRKRLHHYEDSMDDESTNEDRLSSAKTIEAGPQAKISLLEQTKEMAKKKPKLTEIEKEKQKEEEIMEVITHVTPLLQVRDNTTEVKRIKTGWTPPSFIRQLTEEQCNQIREKFHIIVEGHDMPPPITRFQDMKLPKPILDALLEKKIMRPTPIQMQALPAILSGRDLIGIAFTGSGKTLVFSLPMILFALTEELRMPITNGEGPFGLVLCPSRELARQTFEYLEHFTKILYKHGYPELRCMLCMGGISFKDQQSATNRDKSYSNYDVGKGIHMMVATPGRLLHILNEKKINFNLCRYICLDEADRLIDYGFEEDLRNIFSYFRSEQPRQTVLFSATMPEKIQKFAKSSLTDPLVVNVGRAGAASLNVVQEVEFVKQESKMVYLLEVLQKTPPPVLIFCENKSDVDEIYEYLLVKGVEVASIHAGKSQEEREESIRLFKGGKKDVLVATDIVSKGLDFPDIKHVINFDMPKHIDDYVHRIGRTGRGEKTGLATTFINYKDRESILLDLKHLLLEAKQRVPKILQTLHDPYEDAMKNMTTSDAAKAGSSAIDPCKYCGGLGHRITNCPKLEKDRADRVRKISGIDSHLGGGDY
jgi:ATP-dependent RNA helicase DDX41